MRREEPEINFIPLIDVLLVILIFLLVTTTYSRIAELQISLPTGGAERPADPPPEINITVSADNRYAIDGEVIGFVNAASFAAQLRRRAGERKDSVIVVSADAGATHQSVVNVLEAARQAGLPKVTFATQSGGR